MKCLRVRLLTALMIEQREKYVGEVNYELLSGRPSPSSSISAKAPSWEAMIHVRRNENLLKSSIPLPCLPRLRDASFYDHIPPLVVRPLKLARRIVLVSYLLGPILIRSPTQRA